MDRYESESARGPSDDSGEGAGAADTAPGGGTKRAEATGRPWRKGQSGNPAGRPPRPKASGAPGDRLLGADEPTRDVILAEAYRFVMVEEDGKKRAMPLTQAVMRAMGQAALSGNRLAQHRWTRIVREAEREQRKAQTLIYNALERAHYRRNPAASYADDIIFDTTNGDTLIRDLRAPDVPDEAT
ncbi:MAG: DUF5681 domain-containing protein [Sphingomonas sp.]|jgi:hypothetical protein|uniref:DUF5681 domain-containing protein n=1 Tax=Sphingomonas sp. TaxID=28214 RepID=UPI003561EFBE